MNKLIEVGQKWENPDGLIAEIMSIRGSAVKVSFDGGGGSGVIDKAVMNRWAETGVIHLVKEKEIK